MQLGDDAYHAFLDNHQLFHLLIFRVLYRDIPKIKYYGKETYL